MKQDRIIKQVLITLDNVEKQCITIDDFLHDLCEESPEYSTYYKLFDYVWSSLYDVEEKLKML